MKLIVDRLLCESNARCVRECPEVFSLDEDYLLVVRDDIPENLVEKVTAAIDACPRQALQLDQ